MLFASKNGSPGKALGRAASRAQSHIYPNQLPWKAREAVSWSGAAHTTRPPPVRRKSSSQSGAGLPASVQGAERSPRKAGGSASARPPPPSLPLCPFSLLPCPLPAAPKPLPLRSSSPAPRPPLSGGINSAGSRAPAPPPRSWSAERLPPAAPSREPLPLVCRRRLPLTFFFRSRERFLRFLLDSSFSFCSWRACASMSLIFFSCLAA